MNTKKIKKIIQGVTAIETFQNVKLVETHISWILLTRDFAYKIKKPVKFSFLDFSTLAKRKYYCQRELELNQRLAKDIYLQVLPIRETTEQIYIGGDTGKIIDYCVQMKRLNNEKEMKTMLKNGKLTQKDVEKIALILADFHQKTTIVKGGVNPHKLQTDFDDLIQQEDFISHYLGESSHKLLYNVLALSNSFLHTHASRIKWRDTNNFSRDCHGDLHSGNIFILQDPVIFDCIEFNDHFRQIDILNEIAFFCMDLEFYGRHDLSKVFLATYQKHFPSILQQADEELFLYYKLYRANIKVKVNAIKAIQAQSASQFNKRLNLTEQYMNLMKGYYNELSECLLPKTMNKKFSTPKNNGDADSGLVSNSSSIV